MKNMSIFLDLDGVMCDWLTPACNLCNIDIKNIVIRHEIKSGRFLQHLMLERDMWDAIISAGTDFWANLEPFPWADRLWKTLNELGDVCILSSTSHIPAAGMGKMQWIKKHLNTKNFLLGPAKKFCARKGSILVDDTKHRVQEFIDHGGEGFHWPSQFAIEDNEVCLEKTFEDLIGVIQ